MANNNNDDIMLVQEWREKHNDETFKKILHIYEKLIYNVSRTYLRYTLDKDTVFVEGCLGLLHALDKFDVTKNVKFSTYAYLWIRKYIQKYIFKFNNNTAEQIFDNNDLYTTGESIVNDTSTEDLRTIYINALNISMSFLNPIERDVITARFCDNKTLQEIADKLYLSKERVRQIEKQALQNMRGNIDYYTYTVNGFTTIFAITDFSALLNFALEQMHFVSYLFNIIFMFLG